MKTMTTMTLAEAKIARKLHPVPLTVTTKNVFSWNREGVPDHLKATIPVGTKLEVYFSQEHPSRLYFEFGGNIRTLSIDTAHRRLSGPFKNPPTLATLERWSSDGIARTVTGQKTEPDGYGSDGSPSWLLAFSMI